MKDEELRQKKRDELSLLNKQELITKILEYDREKEASSNKRKKRNRLKQSLYEFSLKTIISLFLGSRLYDNSIKLWDAWKNWLDNGGKAKWPENATPDFLASIISRLTRVGLLGLIIIISQPALLIIQTSILFRQNNLIDKQSQLVESTRRASLVIELTSILDGLDEEIDLDEEYWNDAMKKIVKDNQNIDSLNVAFLERRIGISSRLVNRIIAISSSLKPYRYLDEKGDLTNYPSSPERGQLLISILQPNLDFSYAVSNSNFSYSDIENYKFNQPSGVGQIQPMNMSNINLSSSSLHNCTFENIKMLAADFSNAHISDSKFSYCSLYETDFTNADLGNSTFENVIIPDARSFQGSNLENVSFRNVFTTDSAFVRKIVSDAKQIPSITLKQNGMGYFSKKLFTNAVNVNDLDSQYVYVINLDKKAIEKDFNFSKFFLSHDFD